MKHISLIIILLILNFTISAQTYYALPDSNVVWTNSGLAQGSMKYNYKFGLVGDTTINNVIYRKLYADYNNFNFNLSGAYVAAVIRQQNKIVYRYYGGTDEILYDFNLVVGDTAKSVSNMGYNKKKVLSVDSIQINGQFRKRWNFQDEYWIEGIGSSIDLLNPLWYGFDLCRSLLCMSHDSIIVYQNQNPECLTPLPYDCDGVLNPVSVSEISTAGNQTLLFPNPFSNSAVLKTNEYLQDATLTIYDILGQEVFTQTNINAQEIKINRGNLAAGNYYYKLTQKNALISTGKLIIE